MKYLLLIDSALQLAERHGRVHLVWDEAYSQPRPVVREALVGDRPLIGIYTPEATYSEVLDDIKAFQLEAGLRTLERPC